MAHPPLAVSEAYEYMPTSVEKIHFETNYNTFLSQKANAARLVILGIYRAKPSMLIA